MAGIVLFIVNGLIFLWHFDLKHFVDEKDASDWCDNKPFEHPIDY